MIGELMTVEEYAAATRKIRHLQSQLAESEIKALQAYINPLEASRLHQLRRQAAEDVRLGPIRLAAATKESRDYDKRKAAQKRNEDHNAKQRKGHTTQAPPSRAPAPSAQIIDWDDCQHGQEALSCSSTRSRTVSASGPVRTDQGAAA